MNVCDCVDMITLIQFCYIGVVYLPWQGCACFVFTILVCGVMCVLLCWHEYCAITWVCVFLLICSYVSVLTWVLCHYAGVRVSMIRSYVFVLYLCFELDKIYDLLNTISSFINM